MGDIIYLSNQNQEGKVPNFVAIFEDFIFTAAIYLFNTKAIQYIQSDRSLRKVHVCIRTPISKEISFTAFFKCWQIFYVLCSSALC